jgi:hypothetical protein
MRTTKKRRRGAAAFPVPPRRSSPEMKIEGAQRQATGMACSFGVGGVGRLSLFAVREIPRMYPPSPRAIVTNMGSNSGEIA